MPNQITRFYTIPVFYQLYNFYLAEIKIFFCLGVVSYFHSCFVAKIAAARCCSEENS